MTGLHFCPATSGGYGIVRTGADIPESQILMASSNACGRHISISSFDAGYRDRISFYVADESEIFLGTVEDGLVEAASHIIRTRHPKILVVYVCCSTYMSGLDNDRLRRHIKRENPGTEVQIMDMNPVAAGTSNPPAVATQRKILDLLDFSDAKEDAVNLLGSDLPPSSGCEIYDILGREGIAVRHLGLCATWEEFLRMGSSKLNVVLSAKAMQPAKELADRVPYHPALPSYSIEKVLQDYEVILGRFGKVPDLEGYAERTRDRIQKTVDSVGGMTVSVGSTATERPFSMARALYDYGFDVRSVFHNGIPGSEKANLDYLRDKIPDLEVHDCGEPSMSSRIGKCARADIAIGFNAAYFTGTEHMVDMVLDMGLFGFHGIDTLMTRIEDASKHTAVLSEMVEKANLVI